MYQDREKCMNYGYAILNGSVKIESREEAKRLFDQINSDIDSLWMKDRWDANDNALYNVADRVRNELRSKVAG